MGDDFKEKFRAAKAGRTTGKLTKDQLRVLKAQKAQAAAAAAAQPVAAASPDEDTKSMPPPPPRLTPGPSSGAPKPAPASAPAPAPASAPPGRGSYHADSQGTRIQEGGGALGGNLLHSEPSVNKISHPQGQQSEVGASAPPVPTGNATSLAESNALPSGFIDVVVAQGQGSTTGIHLGVVTKAAKSAEGSTGGLEGGEGEPRSGSANPADLATSQLSAMPTWDTAVASRAMPDMQMESAREAASAPAQAPGSLPKNFFDNAAAGAAAMSGPQQHQGTNASAADMDREYAEFMKAVDADEGVADAMAEAAAVEEDEDAVKRSREDFEQFVRLERLREVREAAAKGEVPPGSTSTANAEYATAQEGEKPASALELAGIVADIPAPKLVLPKKRKVSETLAIIEGGGGSSSEDEGEEEEGQPVLDWRAKKSVS